VAAEFAYVSACLIGLAILFVVADYKGPDFDSARSLQKVGRYERRAERFRPGAICYSQLT